MVHPRSLANLRPQRAGEPSRNPGGRPKKEERFGDIARVMLASKKIDITLTAPSGRTTQIGLQADKSFRHALITAMIREGMKGNVQAIKELVDRTDGKVSDLLSLTSDNEVHITFNEVRRKSPDEPHV